MSMTGEQLMGHNPLRFLVETTEKVIQDKDGATRIESTSKRLDK